MRFVLLDRLVHLQKGERALAHKRFAPEEDFFQDHFPGYPLVPGVLLTECMAQTGGWLIGASRDFGVKSVLAMIDGARFRAPVRPGDELEIEARLEALQERSASVAGEIRVSGKTVATAQLVYGLHDLRADGPLSGPVTRAWTQETFARLGGPRCLAAGEQR